MADITLTVKTDANGKFQQTSRFDPPGPFDLRVALSGKLTSPPATRVDGVLDIDAADGTPSNQAKHFRATTGQLVSLGSWDLDGGENIVVLRGRTIPPRANSTLVFELDADLGFASGGRAFSATPNPNVLGREDGMQPDEGEMFVCPSDVLTELNRYKEAANLTKDVVERIVGGMEPTAEMLRLHAEAPAAAREREVFERFMGTPASGKSIYHSRNGKGNCTQGNNCPPPLKYRIPKNAEYVSHRRERVNGNYKFGYELTWDHDWVYVDIWAQGSGWITRVGGWHTFNLYCTFQRDL